MLFMNVSLTLVGLNGEQDISSTEGISVLDLKQDQEQV